MSIDNNRKHIQKRINAACLVGGRDPVSVSLIAVSKMQTNQKIQEALDCGQRLFGENRVQEAYSHWINHKDIYSDLKLHLIGPLQTNKVKEAVTLFDMIQTLDREKLAKALQSEMQKQFRQVPCLVQINTGEESQKAGIKPQELEEFLYFCRKECNLIVEGLMCIPPINEPPALHFALLNKLSHKYSLTKTSMGMSSDFEKAIALGATYIRIGTLFFGTRQE